MTLRLTTPGPENLPRVAEELSRWQCDSGPLHLHPGDLGWHSMVGAERTAADLRVWSRDGVAVAMGLRDADVLRMAMDPTARDDEAVGREILRDFSDPEAGVFGPGEATVEATGAQALRHLLLQKGWVEDEAWIPYQYGLRGRSEDPCSAGARVRIESVGPESAKQWVRVHWSAFKGERLDPEVEKRFTDRWATMARGPFAGLARHLIAFDDQQNPVAVTTVWSAGAGRPGLIEPMGVHRDHRGRGFGAAITRAGVTALKRMGASSATVNTESSNAAANSTYAAAGFISGAANYDLKRPA